MGVARVAAAQGLENRDGRPALSRALVRGGTPPEQPCVLGREVEQASHEPLALLARALPRGVEQGQELTRRGFPLGWATRRFEPRARIVEDARCHTIVRGRDHEGRERKRQNESGQLVRSKKHLVEKKGKICAGAESLTTLCC